jgi:hypothetical protein
MKVYFNKTKSLSYHNEQDSNQQLCTAPRVTRGIAVEREADLPATSSHPDSSKIVT